jgi:hypothetical protein
LITVNAATPLFFSSATIALACAVALIVVVPEVFTEMLVGLPVKITELAILASDALAATVIRLLPKAIGAETFTAGIEFASNCEAGTVASVAGLVSAPKVSIASCTGTGSLGTGEESTIGDATGVGVRV